ncbi:unnamed protein product, partial [Symbiodinium sp. KB8]
MSAVPVGGEAAAPPAEAAGSGPVTADTFHSKTFLTSIRDGGKALDVEALAGDETPETPRSFLTRQIARVLQIQEKEFLEAYRGHMYGVQRELRMWQEKADEEAARALRDAKVQRLEEESAWFRAEALRLNKYTGAMKTDLKNMQGHMDSLEEDRAWLEKQLKAAKRENALLRAEVAVAAQGGQQDEAGELLAALAEGGGETPDVIALKRRVEELTAQVSAAQRRVAELSTGTSGGVGEGSAHTGSAGGGGVSSQQEQMHALFLKCVASVREATDPGSMVSDLSFSAYTPPERRAIIARLLEDDFILNSLHTLVFGQQQAAAAE